MTELKSLFSFVGFLIYDIVVVKEALNNLGIPILRQFNGEEGFLKAASCSQKKQSLSLIRKGTLIPLSRNLFLIQWEFDEFIYTRIPKARRYMHPDTVFFRF